MDPWLPGVIQIMAATAVEFSCSSNICLSLLPIVVTCHVDRNDPWEPDGTFCKKGRLAPGPWKSEPKLGLGLIIEL